MSFGVGLCPAYMCMKSVENNHIRLAALSHWFSIVWRRVINTALTAQCGSDHIVIADTSTCGRAWPLLRCVWRVTYVNEYACLCTCIQLLWLRFCYACALSRFNSCHNVMFFFLAIAPSSAHVFVICAYLCWSVPCSM